MCVACAHGPSRGIVADVGALAGAAGPATIVFTDSLPERFSSASSDAAPSGSLANSSSASLISSESVAGVVCCQWYSPFTRHSGSRRMLQPEYATATVPLRSSTSRFAFSDAGHSVTSGLDWLAATRQLACSAGARGSTLRAFAVDDCDAAERAPHAHAIAPATTHPTTCDSCFIVS